MYTATSTSSDLPRITGMLQGRLAMLRPITLITSLIKLHRHAIECWWHTFDGFQSYINPCRDEVILGYMNYICFPLQFLKTAVVQVIEILHHGTRGLAYSVSSLSWLLMVWRCNGPGMKSHVITLPGIFRFQQQNGQVWLVPALVIKVVNGA